MSIKRGVSLYSYQQEQFFKKMSVWDQIREVREGLHTDGIEIIDEQAIPKYPFGTEEFFYNWDLNMARYNMNPVTMDVFMDVHQMRDHVLSHREAAENLKHDIKLAARMGFKNLRILVLVPTDVIEMALPTAEEYGIKLGKEIHAPLPIVPSKRVQPKGGMAAALNWRSADEIIELAEKTGSKNVGLVPDFGIFQFQPTRVGMAYAKRHAKNPDVIDFIFENRLTYSIDELRKLVPERFPDLKDDPRLGMQIEQFSAHEGSADPEDIKDIIPYIVSIHGKFYEMTEIPGEPGHYEDISINYEDPIRILCENGFDGYINSEYEGQRDQQDMGIENLPDSVEQVRRHHEMLDRLIKKYSK